jgi:exodeoxyribonuclease VII large subunit
VAELCRRLRLSVERVTGSEWIEGEVSSLKRAPSGHLYFCLKDERADAMIDCVMYKLSAMRAGRVLGEGARVQLRGRATVYEKRGRLQLIADAARPAGRGALLEALEKLKAKLLAEGLFDAERKRPLPSDPHVVGVVTSRTGAAVHDIVTCARRRSPVRIVVSNALVQGEGAPESIISALDRLEGYPGLEVVIVGRGGGSGEDLMAFNDERVVRRVAACKVPVVSAVGHEVDVSLTDLAADVRAATPSQAAELVVPSRAERLNRLDAERRHLRRALLGRLHRERVTLERLQAGLSDPRFLIALRQQELDELLGRLDKSVHRATKVRRASVEAWHRRLSSRHPRAVLAEARAALGPLEERLGASMRRHVDRAQGELRARASALDALSPLSILGRGYALATDFEGRAIRNAGDLSPGDEVEVRVKRGSFAAKVTKVLSTVENAGKVVQESPAGAAGEPVPGEKG